MASLNDVDFLQSRVVRVSHTSQIDGGVADAFTGLSAGVVFVPKHIRREEGTPPIYYRRTREQLIDDLRQSRLGVASTQKIIRAYELVRDTHGLEIRRDGTRTLDHVVSVCLILLKECGIRDAATLIDAILHDFEEDTRGDAGRNHAKECHKLLSARFSTECADDVRALSNDPTLRPGKRALLEVYLRQLDAGSERVHLVKEADNLQNLRSLSGTHDMAFLIKQLDKSRRDYMPHFEKWHGDTPHTQRAFNYLLSQIRLMHETLASNHDFVSLSFPANYG